MKLQPGLPNLRSKDAFRCLRAAVRTARRKGFRVAHFALLSNHAHLLIEPGEPRLTRIFLSLNVSFAKRLNRRLGRKGAVFLGRYHQRILSTPTEVRRALAYVLTNEARHRHPGGDAIRSPKIRIDPFSSAHAFMDWKALLAGKPRFLATGWPESFIEAWYSEILTPPTTWLLSLGWLRG